MKPIIAIILAAIAVGASTAWPLRAQFEAIQQATARPQFDPEPSLQGTEFETCENIGSTRYGVKPYTGREFIYALLNGTVGDVATFFQQFPSYKQEVENGLACFEQTVANIQGERDSLDKKERKAYLKEKSGSSRLRRSAALHHARQAVGNYKVLLSKIKKVR